MWVGYKSTPVYYKRDARHAGSSNFSYWRLWNFAVEGITSFSMFPLQIASITGTIMIFSSFVWALLAMIEAITPCHAIWIGFLFFGGIQLLSIGILGEYVGRIYHETKQRPHYFIESTHGIDPKAEAAKGRCDLS